MKARPVLEGVLVVERDAFPGPCGWTRAAGRSCVGGSRRGIGKCRSDVAAGLFFDCRIERCLEQQCFAKRTLGEPMPSRKTIQGKPGLRKPRSRARPRPRPLRRRDPGRAAARRAAVQRRAGRAHRPVGRAHLAAREVARAAAATSPAIAPRSTGAGSAWACWPSCASTPSATRGSATRVLEDAIRELPEVIACHYISGAGTFELQVMRDRPRRLFALLDRDAAQPAEREGHPHQLLARRGQGGRARCRWRT